MSSTPLIYPANVAELVSVGASHGQRQHLPQFQSQLRIWLPVVACLALFAIESTSYLGSDHTSRPLHWIARALFGSGVDAKWKMLHTLIRKTGHFLGYGVLSLLCYRAFWRTWQSGATRLRRKLRTHGLAILATFLVASADELHQSFLPNRCGQFSDVVLDTCGGAVLGFGLFLVMLAVDWLRESRAGAADSQSPAFAE